jgi:predicted nucleotidyltransferase
MAAKRGLGAKVKGGRDEFHRKSMAALQDANVPFLIGGAYVVEAHAGISRRSKDFDLYVRPPHVDTAIDALAHAGYKTEKTFPHWLAKTGCGRDYIDLIFRAGNGLCDVDDSWFERAQDDELLGLHVKLCAPEEMIWMKAYIMERERFDGADIAHILQSCAEKIDWPHLVQRFGPDWRVLLSHLVLFGYIYPSERGKIPAAVMDDLIVRLLALLGSAVVRCYRESNIWWISGSGDFAMRGSSNASIWIQRTSCIGQRRSRAKRMDNHWARPT